jgi:alanyl-tRNA synthetase
VHSGESKVKTGTEIRNLFLEFFEKRGHKVVRSSLLVPDDPSVLLTTAGMQQFKRYYTGELDALKDFGSKNTASVQKCFRTSDIDEVGDESHLTFFEMLGNFSFGGYCKKEAIQYTYDFIAGKDWMNLSIDHVSVFAGDGKIPPDVESEKIWKSLGIKNINKAGREDNFWGPTGAEGPCGPTTEVYVKSSTGKSVEVWNIVFNEYYRQRDRKLEKLKTPGVDTGMGLERLAMVAQETPTIFETDLFTCLIPWRKTDIGKPREPMMKEGFPTAMEKRVRRIMLDHARAVAFLISDGVRPSNKEQGYVLRRLIRRMIAHFQKISGGSYAGTDILSMGSLDIESILSNVVRNYKDFYRELKGKEGKIFEVFREEDNKFKKAVYRGFKELGKVDSIDAKTAFRMYESYGLTYEIIKDFAGAKAKALNRGDFEKEFKKHQEISRAGVEKKFGGHGLVLDTGELKAGDKKELEYVTRLHTATHLLQWALRKTLGETVRQMGSDITAQRLRFDFSFGRKLTDEELRAVEELVNEQIEKNLPVSFKEMTKEEAMCQGALAFFRGKYPDTVKVYHIGSESSGGIISKELCGGPHVSSTRDIGTFKITKEESVGEGVRRVRAIVS